MKFLPICLLFLFSAGLLEAQVPDRTDSLAVVSWLKEKKVPCLAVGFIENSSVRSIYTYGELRPGASVPTNAVFNVASITKTITTMVTLNLVSTGKWHLDEPLARYWTDPDVKDDPRSGKLTTRDILTHRSGFPNWRSELPGKKLAFQFAPGTKYQYSGEGFEYLRHALEHKFHRSLGQLADSIIFRPLHMRDTRFTWDEQMSQRFAYPFNAAGEELPVTKNTGESAADLLKTTVPDYCKFLVWMLKGGGLSKKLFTEMASRQVKIKPGSSMGLGWLRYDLGDGISYALSHGGHDPGVHTLTVLLPDEKKALVIFTNSDNGAELYPVLVTNYLGNAGQSIVDIETKSNVKK